MILSVSAQCLPPCRRARPGPTEWCPGFSIFLHALRKLSCSFQLLFRPLGRSLTHPTPGSRHRSCQYIPTKRHVIECGQPWVGFHLDLAHLCAKRQTWKLRAHLYLSALPDESRPRSVSKWRVLYLSCVQLRAEACFWLTRLKQLSHFPWAVVDPLLPTRFPSGGREMAASNAITTLTTRACYAGWRQLWPGTSNT